MAKIIDLHAREILDSRGNPTVEVELYTEECIGSAAVPSGASTGSYEALERRDGGKRYGGKGVEKVVKAINTTLKQALAGHEVTDQTAFDAELLALDGTPNKRKYGANGLLGLSLAASRAASAAYEMPLYAYLARLAGNPVDKFTLPLPYANVINGGRHAGNALQVQEFMIVPIGAKTVDEAVRIVAECYQALKGVIEAKFGKAHVGDEGGFAPPIATPEEALKLLVEAVKQAGYERKIGYALDAAASEFYAKGKYEVEQGQRLTATELAVYWLDLLKRYPIISLEDPFAEDDFDGWEGFMTLLGAAKFKSGRRPQIVGDDLTVSNPDRIRIAIERGLCDALLLKVNQIGTLSEALDAAKVARSAGWHVMVSHRSGETEDPYIADLAVGLGCGQAKIGAPCRGERTAKYNQLLRIAEELGKNGKLEK